MFPSHPYSPLSSLKLSSFASSNRRSLTTLSILLVFPLLAFLASYPVHQGHPIESLSYWSEEMRRPPQLEDGGGGPRGGRGEGRKLEPCERTMLYTFSGPWGFASEFMIFLRAAQFAQEQGYAILLDSDREWTYVNMAEYLLPNRLDCVPRPEWRTRERTAVGSEGWRNQSHLRTSRNDGMWDIQAEMRAQYKRPETSGEVDDDPSHHHHEPSALLPTEMTLMPGYKDLFLSLSSVVKELWRPTEIISLQVDELVAKHRLRERLSVGVHIRMGDKASEQEADMLREGGDSEFRQGNLTAYLTAAQEMLPLLQASHPPSRHFDLKPLLLVMSDSPHVAAELKSGVLMHHDYEVAQLPDPPNQPEEGHDQGHFNAMGWRERVETGEGFVRDLTIVGQVTNGFIGTASSNVGRLLALLCGPEKVMHQQLARSLDTPFYWTVDFEKWT